MADASDAANLCDELEADLAKLRASYEQYFLGMERMPPTAEHNRMKKRVNELRNGFHRQTAIKFRVGNLYSKFMSYERLWLRTLQEIENGTYARDLFKARMHAKKREAERNKEAPAATQPTATAQATPAAPGATAKPAAKGPAPTTAAISDQKIKAIYEAYVTAKKKCNEDISKLSLDTMAASLRKQVPELLKQHKAKSVEFKVVIKDGKAVLRAIPKE